MNDTEEVSRTCRFASSLPGARPSLRQALVPVSGVRLLSEILCVCPRVLLQAQRWLVTRAFPLHSRQCVQKNCSRECVRMERVLSNTWLRSGGCDTSYVTPALWVFLDLRLLSQVRA